MPKTFIGEPPDFWINNGRPIQGDTLLVFNPVMSGQKGSIEQKRKTCFVGEKFKLKHLPDIVFGIRLSNPFQPR